MISFKRLKFSNLCSYGDVPFDLDLSAAKVVAFTGQNGSGKSTILDALSFVLYGKPWRKVPKGKLVNNRNKRGTYAEISFSTEKNEYVVKRGIKPDLFEIWRDGELVNQDAKSKDYQTVLENEILRLSWQAFNQVVVIGKATYTPFMQLEAAPRRVFVESILSLQIFSVMKDLLRADLSAKERELSAAEAALKVASPQVATAEKTLSSYVSMRDSTDMLSSTEAAAKVDEAQQAYALACQAEEEAAAILRGLVAAAADAHAAKTREIKAELVPANNDLTAALAAQKVDSDAVALIQQYAEGERREARRLRSSADALDTRTTCPTCGGPIDASTVLAHRTELLTRADEHEAAANASEPDLEEAKKALDASTRNAETKKAFVDAIKARDNAHAVTPYDRSDAIVEAKAVLAEKTQAVSMAVRDLDHARSQHSSAVKRETELDGLIATAQSAVEAAVAQVASYTKQLEEVNARLQVLTANQAMLKDTGIKATILRRYVPVINKIVNKLLADMGFFARFELDEEFNDKILSRGFEEMTYNSFSEGEKLRIDMAVLLAWRELCIMTGSSSTNLIIFDEILDASFDQQGLDAFMKALVEKDDINLVCITHHVDRIDEFVDRQYGFAKVDGYSVFKEIVE